MAAQNLQTQQMAAQVANQGGGASVPVMNGSNSNSNSNIVSAQIQASVAHNLDPDYVSARLFMTHKIYEFLMQRQQQSNDETARKALEVVIRLEEGLFRTAATKIYMGDKKVYKCGDIVVRHCDLDTLEGPRLLNDQIIAFYFTYLSSSFNTKTKTETLLVTPSISLWIANCGDDKSVEDYVQSCEMSSKRLVLFVISDTDDFGGGDSGSHWSILVYDRMKNLFLHFDSIKGLNNPYAVKLYDVLKQFMGPGGESSSPHTSSSLLKKKQRKKKKSVPYVNRGSEATVPPVTRESEATPLAGLPMYNECETAPQQFNGYDCGMYVLAIARAICQWCSHEHNRSDMISTIEKNVVSSSVENNMRDEVMKIILEMATDN